MARTADLNDHIANEDDGLDQFIDQPGDDGDDSSYDEDSGELSEEATEDVPAQSLDEILEEAQDTPPSPTTELTEAMRHEPTGLEATSVIVQVPVEEIAPDPAQARDEGADDELADSIKANGFYESKPLELRPHPNQPPMMHQATARYMIVDGERRYRGALKAGLTHVPAIITDAAEDVGDRLLRQVNSNTGKPMKPMEEARTYKRIMTAKSWNIQQLATHLGKSKSTVSDRVAMAEAPARFQQFFVDGTLSAAAAPIVRQIAALPEAVQDKIVKHATTSWDWRQYADRAQTIPTNKVLAILGPDGWTFPVVEGIGKDFPGETFEFKGKRHAVDRSAWTAHIESVQRDGKPATVTRDRHAEQRVRDDKKRREAAARKRELRRAQFTAISAKLPTSIDGAAALYLIKALAHEQQQLSQIAACKALDIGPEKKSPGGANFEKLIVSHAEKLDGKGRIRMLLQLAMGGDLQVSEYDNSDARLLKDAAKLARVDLAKVKVQEPKAKAAPATKKLAAKKPTKKAKRRTPNAAFMKPYPLTSHLEAVVGRGPMTRTEVTKKIWGYIKRNGLQDKKERRMINADEKLKQIFKSKKQVSMFEMTKLLNKHLVGYRS